MQFPLSQAQKLWFSHGQRETQSLVLQLERNDSFEQFQQAWQQLVASHDILRMQFMPVAGVTLPVMQESANAVSIIKAGDPQISLLATQSSLATLSLSEPLTVHWITHNAGNSLVIRALPYLLDAQSLQLVISALQQIVAGEFCAALDAENITQYPDFCAWLSDLQVDEDAIEAQQFWRAQQIDAASGGLFEQGASNLASEQPLGCVSRSINTSQSRALEDWALTHSAFDPEEGQQGALEQALVFLARVQQQRISIGQPALYWLHDCRLDYDELCSCFGPMARPLALTQALNTEQSLLSAWHNWQQHCLEMLEAQENVPEFSLKSFMSIEFLPEIDVIGERTLVQWESARLTTPLNLQIQQDQGALHLSWLYDAEQFSDHSVQAMAESFMTLVSQLLAADIEHPLGNLALNATSQATPVFSPSSSAPNETIPALLQQIHAQAQQNPQQVALQNAEQTLSYGQLWQQVSALSQAISAHNTAQLATNPVAIFLPRGINAVVAMLATWASEGFYVILDSDWPLSRLQAVLEQAQPALVLYQESAPAFATSAAQIDISTVLNASVDPLTPSPQAASATQIAYLLFTSGSTGTPKAVQVSQRNLAHYVDSATKQLSLAQYQGFLHCATFAADMGHTVLFPALTQGKTLHIPPMTTLTNAQTLASYLQTHQIQVIKYVPSHLQALISSNDGNAAPLLPQQCVILGGEPCSGDLLQNIKNASPTLAIFNHYGPTETTVGVAFHPVTQVMSSTQQGLPLTQSFGDTRVFLLTAAGNNAALGELGEVVIQGSNVSLGYRGEHANNASQGFFTLNGEAAYRTGDLARLNSQGELYLAGRADHQVKIRGFRVELGDIEAALSRAENVTHAAVKLHTQNDSQWLIAYASGNQLNEDQLNAWLAEQLPDMMRPQRLVILDTMPLLASGKIDRQQLPSIDTLASQDLGTCEPAANDVEYIVQQVFQQVLGMQDVGVTWDFFAIGGHSLSAIKITGQLRKQLQIDLPPGLLFEHSSIRKLAIAAQQHESEPGKLAAVAKIRRQLANMTPEQMAALKAKQAAKPS